MTASRRQARERALGLLYEAEVKGESPVEVMRQLPVAPDDFAADLVSGVASQRDRLDGLIGGFAVDWALDRMPVIDLCILRLAAYELADRPDIPVSVILSEAVELAKGYSTEQSGRFVNGLLASVAASVRPSPEGSWTAGTILS